VIAGRRVGELEAEVLQRLWAISAAVSGKELRTHFADRPLAYTSLMTALSRLVDKGLVERIPEGRTIRFRAAGDPDKVERPGDGPVARLSPGPASRARAPGRGHRRSRAPAGDVADSIRTDGDTAFPEFTLAGADGMSITKTSLAGTKSLIWFTRSTCPDSEGMQGVAGLDDELSGKAFTIVVVLVDLHEPAPWLDEWRDSFGRPDWKVAPEEPAGLWAKHGEPGLESKFLLDEQSTVIDTTTRLVDADYLATLREYLA